MKKIIIDLTIVIPTVGEKSIFECIKCIKNSSYQPKEVFLVIPNEYSQRISSLENNKDSIKIIKTNSKGQVLQKIKGFNKVSSKYMMQLDADILLEKNAIKILHKFMVEKNNKVAVAPLLIPNNSNKFKYKFNFFNFIKNYIISGSNNLKSGIITDIGYNTWFEIEELTRPSYLVEWLPGGCILFSKEFSIDYNYYPFKNKAYCEDIIHSICLKQKDIKLFLLPKAQAYNIGYKKSKTKVFDKIKEFNVRYYLLKKIKGNKIRFLIWFIIYVIK